MPKSPPCKTGHESVYMTRLPRRSAAGRDIFAAASGATLAPVAQISRTREKAGFFRACFAQGVNYASFNAVEVVLRKVGRKSGRAVVGRLLRPPRKGSVVVIEFADGLHEYVTTPVKRVLQLCGQDTYYLQTANSRYRLEVRSDESGVVDHPVAN